MTNPRYGSGPHVSLASAHESSRSYVGRDARGGIVANFEPWLIRAYVQGNVTDPQLLASIRACANITPSW